MKIPPKHVQEFHRHKILFPYSKYLVITSVSRHFPYSRDFVFSPVSRIQGILLFSWNFPYSRDFVALRSEAQEVYPLKLYHLNAPPRPGPSDDDHGDDGDDDNDDGDDDDDDVQVMSLRRLPTGKPLSFNRPPQIPRQLISVPIITSVHLNINPSGWQFIKASDRH